MPRIRVMTFNIWLAGRGGRWLHETVREASPDVLLVNECPKTPWLWRSRCRALAESWGMRFVAGGRDAGSNMIAVRHGVAVRRSFVRTIPQPWSRPRRGIAAAQLRVQGRLLGAVCCHLSLDAEQRVGEAEHVLEVARGLRGPVFVGGDLNERPGGPSWRRLQGAGYVDHGSGAWPTFPADDPVTRIDALLVAGSPVVLHHGDPGVDERVQTLASDHRAVLMVVEL